MVRNAGGRVLDAIRTFAVLQTIGSPGTIVVMHHTGMSSNPPPRTFSCSGASASHQKLTMLQRLWNDAFPRFSYQGIIDRTCP